LKQHILPRIKAQLKEEAMATSDVTDQDVQSLDCDPDGWKSVFFKSDRIYQHRLLKVNYTSYDIRRSQDVINPGASHWDIMMLAGDDDENDSHRFLYARVLGIYHTNVIYTGPGMLDYSSRRLDFLWVRWFQRSTARSPLWGDCKLDMVRFLPMADQHAFGFLDPKDVLRGCHMLPAFTYDKLHRDGISMSKCVNDGNDWSEYYVGRFVPFLFRVLCFSFSCPSPRFVDRDMIM
jgi:hypothetical protein